jgi:hypothetical protein
MKKYIIGAVAGSLLFTGTYLARDEIADYLFGPPIKAVVTNVELFKDKSRTTTEEIAFPSPWTGICCLSVETKYKEIPFFLQVTMGDERVEEGCYKISFPLEGFKRFDENTAVEIMEQMEGYEFTARSSYHLSERMVDNIFSALAKSDSKNKPWDLLYVLFKKKGDCK